MKEKNMDAPQIVKGALDASPEMRLVLEAATRAREVEQMTPPLNYGLVTEITSSQYPGPRETQNQTQNILS